MLGKYHIRGFPRNRATVDAWNNPTMDLWLHLVLHGTQPGSVGKTMGETLNLQNLRNSWLRLI